MRVSPLRCAKMLSLSLKVSLALKGRGVMHFVVITIQIGSQSAARMLLVGVEANNSLAAQAGACKPGGSILAPLGGPIEGPPKGSVGRHF